MSTRTILTLLLVAANCSEPARPTGPSTIAITDVRVFDGEQVIPRAVVVVRGHEIVAVTLDGRPPTGAQIVDGRGKTLLPGLIDSHAHVMHPRALEDAAVYGVTSMFDMFNLHMAELRRHRRTSIGLADFHSAGLLITAPGGHATQWVPDLRTISAASECEPFIDAQIADGAEWVKIVVEDGEAWGTPLGVLPEDVVKKCIDVAHARGKLALVHATSVKLGTLAAVAGADGLVHMPADDANDDALLAALVRNRAFVVPTASLLFALGGRDDSNELARDPRLARNLHAFGERALQQRFPFPKTAANVDAIKRRIVKMHRAGIPILVGTDAPTPPTLHGISMHEEVVLLVEAGLSPTEVLRAATVDAARAFRFTDRGRIAPGLRADLLLVRADPTRDITSLRDIERVWVKGRIVDRELHARRVDVIKRYSELHEAKRHADGAALLAAELAKDPDHDDARYQLACAFALSGRAADALRTLSELVANAPMYRYDAARDDDLVSLRDNPDFQRLLR